MLVQSGSINAAYFGMTRCSCSQSYRKGTKGWIDGQAIVFVDVAMTKMCDLAKGNAGAFCRRCFSSVLATGLKGDNRWCRIASYWMAS
ncbi:hypothetical protein D3Y57_02840 (plasmid) [Sphingomonas paeninsulae]|uniref:Uncharacterized protein n=1 Tax=Sphingomonas paeninsulae TaxID=2319844 RepID=A0A494TGQ4_SPHPE|nr:hypothetical protein D3Y57_02840 [Sphingomonas paeninsulae]